MASTDLEKFLIFFGRTKPKERGKKARKTVDELERGIKMGIESPTCLGLGRVSGCIDNADLRVILAAVEVAVGDDIRCFISRRFGLNTRSSRSLGLDRRVKKECRFIQG